jgi:hypothetical protein
MILRWTTLIAVLIASAAYLTLLTSTAPLASEAKALQVAEGPGDSGEPGAAPGEAGDEPAVAPGTSEPEGATEEKSNSEEQSATPAKDDAKDEAAPEPSEAAKPADNKDAKDGEKTETKSEEPSPAYKPQEITEEPKASDEKPEAGKPEEAAGKPDAKEPEPKPEESAAKPEESPAKPEENAAKPELTADASAAAEKVKLGDIPVPTDPVALAAFDALQQNCSRCHQAGPTLKREKPAKNFGNILHLDELAKDPHFILPGNPDGSKLFVQVAKKEMPYDCYQDFDCKREPTEKEVQAIYDWIKSLGAAQLASCTDRKVIDEEAIVTDIGNDIDQQQEHRRKGMRYITLSNFYNACAPETDMVRYRQGVVKLLNSLSRSSDVLKMRTIDPDQTIIAFNLDDLGWTEADWNQIISTYPYAMKPDATVYKTVAEETDTPLAWIRGDWFAFTASRPPLYYDLLKLPKTFAEFEKQVPVDVKSDIEKFLVKRAGFQNSGVSKHNRLIERHAVPAGYFWTSYDFKGDRPEQSLFIHPLGPDGEGAFKHDGGETIFSLPNGFQAYYLNKATGERLDKGPTEIVLDDSQLDRAVTDGISCMGCHNQGIRQATDDIRKHVLGDRTFSKEVREQVEALYPSPEEFKDQLDGDGNRFKSAEQRAGLDPELDSQKVGVESINFLSKAYEKSVDLRLAAAEYGIAADAFAQGLADAGGESAQLKRRLEQGVLPREILEAEFKDLIVKVSDNEPIDIVAGTEAVAKVGGQTKEQTHDFDLLLISDRSDYKVNDLPVFTIKSKENCNLTLINVDASGEGTVIFPNKFQQDNFLPAGKEVQFPGSSAPFQFRLKDPGTETVIAICNASGKEADGIKHDFKKREFTPLGNYRGFLTRQITVEGAEKIAEGKATKKEGGPGSDILSRTAIKLQVK